MNWRAWCTLLLAAALAGCAATPRTSLPKVADDCRPDQATPVLRLSPASLGKELAVQQQLSVTTRGQTQRVDVLLEVDATTVRLALVTMGQTAARLEWDGQQLSETRSSWLPAVVSGERGRKQGVADGRGAHAEGTDNTHRLQVHVVHGRPRVSTTRWYWSRRWSISMRDAEGYVTATTGSVACRSTRPPATCLL